MSTATDFHIHRPIHRVQGGTKKGISINSFESGYMWVHVLIGCPTLGTPSQRCQDSAMWRCQTQTVRDTWKHFCYLFSICKITWLFPGRDLSCLLLRRFTNMFGKQYKQQVLHILDSSWLYFGFHMVAWWLSDNALLIQKMLFCVSTWRELQEIKSLKLNAYICFLKIVSLHRIMSRLVICQFQFVASIGLTS